MAPGTFVGREPEVSWQTMSVPVPLIGKGSKWRQRFSFLRKFNVDLIDEVKAFKNTRVMCLVTI